MLRVAATLLACVLFLSFEGCSPTGPGGGCGSSSSSSGSSSSSSGGNCTTAATANYQLGYSDATGNFHQGAMQVGTPALKTGQSSTLTLTLVDVNNSYKPYSGSPVSVAFTSKCAAAGTATLNSPVTTANGSITSTYTAAGCSGTDTVTASVTLPGSTTPTTATGAEVDTTPNLQLGYIDTNGNFHPGALFVASPTLSSGQQILVQTVVVDANNNDAPYSGSIVQVSFSSPCSQAGTSTITSPINTNTGAVSTTYTAQGCSGSDAITASATIGTSPAITAQTPVMVKPSNYAMGYLDANAGFHQGAISIGQTPVAAGGSSALQVAVVDLNNGFAPYKVAPLQVSFSSPCSRAGTASLVTPVTTASGAASSAYTANGCSGSDTVTASATLANGQTVTATGGLQVQSPVVGSLAFVSATPSSLGIQGTGIPGTATVIFKLLDQNNNAAVGQTVSFALDNTIGGVSLGSENAVTATDGTARVTVTAGTAHTIVHVTASITAQGGATISSQSAPITVSTTLPTSASFSLSLTCPNQEMLAYDGVQVPITVRATDRFNYAVPDGTAIFFKTESGHVDPSCSTAGGACTVNFTSQNPRPDGSDGGIPGRSTLLAYAVGEEGFTDENATGLYAYPDPFANLGELWVDYNENGVHDTFEPFLDFNDNGQFDGPDGLFHGLLCVDTAHCGSSPRLNVGQSAVLVFSGSSPGFNYSRDVLIGNLSTGASYDGAGTFTFPAGGGTGQVGFTIRDVNQQPLANGSTIAATSSFATIEQPASFSVPCTTDSSQIANTYLVAFTVPGGNSGTGGTLLLTVTSPKGVKTSVPFNIILK